MTQANGVLEKPNFASMLNVTFEPIKPVDVHIDINLLTAADMNTFSEMASEDSDNSNELFKALLQKVMPDNDVEELPLYALGPLSNMLMDAVKGATDPND